MLTSSFIKFTLISEMCLNLFSIVVKCLVRIEIAELVLLNQIRVDNYCHYGDNNIRYIHKIISSYITIPD